MSNNSALKPKIWVGCLAAYNQGDLHGKWIDANQEPEELLEAIKVMLEESPAPGAEEWGIFDHECFGGIKVGEWESLETISKWASGIAEHGLPYALWVVHRDEDEHDPDCFTDHYFGHYESMADFGEEEYRQRGTVPEALEDFVNWERYAENICNGSFYGVKVVGDGVHIFTR